MRKLSAVIITKNEERNIERCLESVYDIAEDIVVVDAFSTDKTEEICFKYNVRFIQREWTNYADARNYAMALAANDFVLSIDADEILSNELKDEIVKLKQQGSVCAYQFNRITRLGSKWIEHSGWFPDWKTRIFDRKVAQWQGLVHEKPVLQAGIAIQKLKGLCYHFSFESDDELVAKTENYAELSAISDFKIGRKPSAFQQFIKPALKFIVIYFFKFGFLDGKEGMLIAKTAAHGVRHRQDILRNLYSSKTSAR